MDSIDAVGTEPAVAADVPVLKSTPMRQVKRKIDLSGAATAPLQETRPVESLVVREKKGAGSTFTPNTGIALSFHGLAYKPPDEFETIYQIITGALLNDPRIASRAKKIVFVPSLDWSSHELILVPLKLTKFGARVFLDFKKLESQFPHFKVFAEWDEIKRRHVVHQLDLSVPEREIITRTKWPTRDEILDALSAEAYDNIDDLGSDNADIAALISSREVE